MLGTASYRTSPLIYDTDVGASVYTAHNHSSEKKAFLFRGAEKGDTAKENDATASLADKNTFHFSDLCMITRIN